MTAELPAGMRGELAGVLAAHPPTETQCGPLYCPPCSEAIGDWVQWTPEHAADALTPLIAGWLAAAEQRGGEDNAEHGMCYVHGSRALEAKLAAAKAEAVRAAVEEHAETFGVACSTSRAWLRDRADRIGGER